MGNTKTYPPLLPLDMGQFNTVTEGKSTYQDELLALFFQNAEECLVVLSNNCATKDSEKWQDVLEELKNISNAIGALELAKICAVAEKMGTYGEEEKKKTVTSVKMHIQRLRAFIRNTRY